jgi:hypothetical protein
MRELVTHRVPAGVTRRELLGTAGTALSVAVAGQFRGPYDPCSYGVGGYGQNGYGGQ